MRNPTQRRRLSRACVPFACLAAALCTRCGSGSSGGASPGGLDASLGADDTGLVGAGSSGGGSTGSGSGGGGAGANVDGSSGTGLDASALPDVGSPVEAGSPGPSDITFVIHATDVTGAISPYVYGVNNGAQAGPHHATIVRNGGNRLTAYNWENNASNAGSDYQFENDGLLSSSNTPGAYLKTIVDQAVAAGAAALITVPIVDYVAADKSPGGDVRNSGANYLMTRFKMNGIKGTGLLNPPDTTDAYVYQDEMVNWLTKTEPSATIRYMLDNEPDLWSSTHAEIHPTPVTYAELAQRNIKFAKAVKAVVPGVEVWGPVNYGWAGYVSLQNATDSAADGDFIEWWLDQMSAAAKTAGSPVVDGLDLHWYSEAGDGGNMAATPGSDCRINTDPSTTSSLPADCSTTAGKAGVVSAREQAPRSLWDPTYVENSWIAASLGDKAIQLIPRMKTKIAQHAPQVKLSFSEWNYGGGSDISGTIATADVLGIFGAYGVDMSMLWELWHDESFTYAAYDVYRNYDGHGATFGDTSVSASTSDPVNSSAYASIAASDPSHTVIVLINKATTGKVAGIQIGSATVFTKASVFTVTQAGGAKVVPGTAITSVATNAFHYTMPAQSVSVLLPAP